MSLRLKTALMSSWTYRVLAPASFLLWKQLQWRLRAAVPRADCRCLYCGETTSSCTFNWTASSCSHVSTIVIASASYSGDSMDESTFACMTSGGAWPGLSIGVVKKLGFLGFLKNLKNLKSPNFRFLGLKKPENLTDLKVSKFLLLLLSCIFYRVICLIKVTFKLYCSNRVCDVLHVLLGRNFVSDLPTLKPKKPLKNFFKNLKTF